MLKCYFDAGGQYADCKFITLAGAVADESIWADIETQWNTILRNRDPQARILHTARAASLNGEFSPENRWTNAKVETLITELLLYMQQIDKKRFRLFAATLDVDAHRNLCMSDYLLDHYVDILNDHSAAVVIPWYYDQYPGAFQERALFYYFDKGEPYHHPFRQKWMKMQDDPAWRMIADVQHADRTAVGIQMADLWAWANNRQESTEHDRFTRLCYVMRQIVPTSSVVFTEEKLRQRYDLPATAHPDVFI
jgi:hypothetical protein